MMLKSRVTVTCRLRGMRCASSAFTSPNWLEENCGDVPIHPQTQDSEVSEMLRGGHAMQVASAKMLDAKVNKVADFHVVKTYSTAHLEKLKELRDTEEKAVQRIEASVRTKDFRFRPSLLIPAVQLSSFVVGCALSPLGDTISTSYVTGVKMAVSDYYNDQIREIYASKPDQVELKELFKVARDEEQEFVDAHTPDILDPNKGIADPVTTFAKASLKVMIQVAKTV
ncbi:5-demethoxyubiquinone hydroxylase [Phytophthora citrophthora]|uniref:5-demethoxyubiquinone hydroxylase n=1 Tax=Phytophthora citrophthora TaxID=4793 RepID=A0AAD9LTB5_9STRA|nr:5-demethoxyubiquinone hydroxylase [Phytophthora citrophthora]